MTAAAIKASFADWKLIKTRAVVQIVFEVPLHEADSAYKVVGGMPDAAKERWFAIARLNEKAAADPVKESPASRSFNELPLPQQAALTCKRQSFHAFIREQHPNAWSIMNTGTDEERAALFVQATCGVKSRSEILPGTPAAKEWERLANAHHDWLHILGNVL